MSQTGAHAISTVRTPAIKQNNLVDKFGLDPDQMTPAERRSAISGYDLRYRIEALVAGVSKKKIRHVYAGDGAATGPGIMLLPRIVATSLFPMRHARILLGYTAHEISHQLNTDFGLITTIFADPERPTRRELQIKEFWNAIEDYRIEKLVKADYPGFHVYINDTRDFSARRFIEAVDAGLYDDRALANPYRMGSVALTWVGAALNGYATRAPAEALARIDGDLKNWAESWAPDMARVTTCAEARDLAIRIIDDLDQMRQDANEDEADGTSKAQSQEQSGQSGGASHAAQNEQDRGDASPKEDQPENNQKEDPGRCDTQNEAASEGRAAGKDKQESAGAESPTGDGQKEQSTEDKDEAADNEGSAGASAKDNDAGPEDHEGGSNPQEDEDAGGCNGTSNGQEQDGASPENNEMPDGGNQSKAPGDADRQNEAQDGQANDTACNNAQTAGGNGEPRPRPKVRNGDENAEAEVADLEIDELAKAINSMQGSDAVDADICEGEALSKRVADGDSVQETVRRGQQKYAAKRAKVSSSGARSAGLLRRLLQSRDRKIWRGGKEEGDLDFGRLVPMTRGAPDIYRQKEERRAIHTALYLLLDNSGSMRDHPLKVCQEAAIVLDMAVIGTPTKIEITGFTGSTQKPVLYRYRTFEQSGQAASATLGNMDEVELGGTPVSTPLLEAWRRLQQRKEPRRIMIVVSDGGADYNDVQAARAAHDFVRNQGCLILGLAIGEPDPMKQWCDAVQSINSVDELPRALTALVQEALR